MESRPRLGYRFWCRAGHWVWGLGFGVGARPYLARGKHASEVGHVVHLVRVRVRARVRARARARVSG